MIRIIDCGSQLTQNIARRVRELGVFSEVLPFYSNVQKVITPDLEGIIISGGQFSVYDKNSPLYSREILTSNLPVLGICYGQQSIAHLLGGKVIPTSKREYGSTSVEIIKESRLFEGVIDKKFTVWMSHGDIVEKMPSGFSQIAISSNNHIAAMQKENVYAVQFHPEVEHTENGRKILNNFINICNAKRTWDPEKDYERILEETKDKIKGKIGIGGISGGIDSTAVSVLIGKIAGNNYHPIFIDNGLLRLNESEQVIESLKQFKLNVRHIDASSRFLSRLKGINDLDKKREIIGYEFISVFEEASKLENASYLVQGTLYPDVIESVPLYGSSSKIKRHHNVGGLPENMNLQIVEPFRYMFKDEIRKIVEHKLNIPKNIIWRHPFPGPGLAVRIIGEVNPEKLTILRQVDDIFIEEIKNRDLYYKIDQAFAVLTDLRSVGVMGDEGNYQYIAGLRAVNTTEFMTADWHDFRKEDLTSIANRIINEVKGINRVVYDISQKPPATIEWE